MEEKKCSVIIVSEMWKLRLRKVKLLANYDTAGKKQIWDLILAVSDFKICDLRLGFKAQFS